MAQNSNGGPVFTQSACVDHPPLTGLISTIQKILFCKSQSCCFSCHYYSTNFIFIILSGIKILSAICCSIDIRYKSYSHRLPFSLWFTNYLAHNYIFSDISEWNNDYSNTLDLRRGWVGEVVVVMFFVLEVPDYESAMLIYLYTCIYVQCVS